MNGTIISINKYIHNVLLEDGNVIGCTTRGKLRNNNIVPLVGDNVLVSTKDKTIEEVFTRKNSLYRPLVANIDKLIIVASTTIPAFSTYLIDKFIVIALANNITPVIVITKTDKLDLKSKLKIHKYVKYYRHLGYKVYYNKNINKIKKEFSDSLVCLCGQTGAGKSTLLNKIDKNLNLQTGEVSLSLNRGKHTTRLAEIIYSGDLKVIDTPGFSNIDLLINKKDLKNYYKEFNIDCKYKSCLHVREDGCEIKRFIGKKIPLWRYENYIKLLGEAHE